MVPGDNEMVKHFHFDERQRVPEAARQQLISVARLRDARRMIVGEDDSGGINLSQDQRLPKRNP